jgi:hypothetical protein
MVKINFDEPSAGNVNSGDSALEINQTGGGAAIYAKSKKSIGIIVEAGDPFGNNGIGIHASGYGENATGIEGRADKGIGVKGSSLSNYGISGSGKNAGVLGRSNNPDGVGILGESDWQSGVLGRSLRGKVGVRGECKHVEGAGVEGVNNSTARGIGVLGMGGTGVGILGRGIPAGRFEGDVEVTGDIKLLNPMNADCAEDFDILEENVEPGTVMVLTDTGSLQSSHQAYDNKVVGIISGAGGYKPAFILNRYNQSEIESLKDDKKKNKRRLPIALMGKVFCKVDATQYPIEVGDLLTTSSTRGFAMKAGDPMKAFGAIIGKALGSVKNGFGVIPVLVNLQ